PPVATTGTLPPPAVKVSNIGDVPVSNKLINVVDRVTGTATYDTDSQLMTVNAVSSDTANPRPLTVPGYGDLTAGPYVSGQLDAPPATVTVKSDAGGSV